MSSKVILLKYVACTFNSPAAVADLETQLLLQRSSSASKTAVIIKKTRDGHFSIQGFPPISQSDKHGAWTTFQQAAKELLGLHRSTAICIRFADDLYKIVVSLSDLFHEPSHLLNLVVHPIPSSSSSSHTISNSIPPPLNSKYLPGESNNPYRIFRERHCSGTLTCGAAREKYSLAEMNKLLSQLAEVNIFLLRTQQECDLIARRCAKTENSNGNDDTKIVGKKDVKSEEGNKKIVLNSFPSSSSGCDSGKGSLTESDDVVEAGEEEADCEAVTSNSTPCGTGDERIEQLLKIAQSLTLQNRQLKQRGRSCLEATPTFSTSLSQPTSSTCLQLEQHGCSSSSPSLPDPPSQVVVRPSFRHGGVFIMWDPVRLDGSDLNAGHKVLGYHVYVDQQLRSKVKGSLTSQVEVTGMEDGAKYLIQACTECESCTSLLTSPLTYRHQETNRSLTASQSRQILEVSRPHFPDQHNPSHQSTPIDVLSTPLIAPPAEMRVTSLGNTVSEHCKVHTWLKTSFSDLNELQSTEITDKKQHTTSLRTDEQKDIHTNEQRDHTSLPTDDHTSLHVHFASEDTCIKCADDTKSISSSHTSGIVTDFNPISPKLIPFCSCSHCSDSSSGFSTSSHYDEDNKVRMLGTCDEEHSQSQTAPKVNFSTDPVPIPKLSSSYQSCRDIVGTVIDEPLNLDVTTTSNPQPPHSSKRPVNLVRSSRSLSREGKDGGGRRDTSDGVGGEEWKRKGRSSSQPPRNHKGPKPPSNVTVSRIKRGKVVLVSWSPVQRDSKGRSNGFYVLGYRIYINGSYQQSVDGAMTVKAALTSPILYHLQQDLSIHVRTRSIAAESLPSNSVTYHPLCQQRTQLCVTNSLLETCV